VISTAVPSGSAYGSFDDARNALFAVAGLMLSEAAFAPSAPAFAAMPAADSVET